MLQNIWNMYVQLQLEIWTKVEEEPYLKFSSTHCFPFHVILEVLVHHLLSIHACSLHQCKACLPCFESNRLVSNIHRRQVPMAARSACNALSSSALWEFQVAMPNEEFYTKCTEDHVCWSLFDFCGPRHFSIIYQWGGSQQDIENQ